MKPDAVHDDEFFMAEALRVAQLAARDRDVPVGAVVVLGGRVIGVGRNRREADSDPTGHAEIVALREACRSRGRWRVDGATLYVTLEPCPMCAGAIVNARVARVVYGAADPKAGAVRSLYQVCDDPRLNHRARITAGVLAEPCAELLREFFRDARGRLRAAPGQAEQPAQTNEAGPPAPKGKAGPTGQPDPMGKPGQP